MSIILSWASQSCQGRRRRSCQSVNPGGQQGFLNYDLGHHSVGFVAVSTVNFHSDLGAGANFDNPEHLSVTGATINGECQQAQGVGCGARKIRCDSMCAPLGRSISASDRGTLVAWLQQLAWPEGMVRARALGVHLFDSPADGGRHRAPTPLLRRTPA